MNKIKIVFTDDKRENCQSCAHRIGIDMTDIWPNRLIDGSVDLVGLGYTREKSLKELHVVVDALEKQHKETITKLRLLLEKARGDEDEGK